MSEIQAGRILNETFWNRLEQLKKSDDLSIQGYINIGDLLNDLKEQHEIVSEKRNEIIEEYGVEIEKPKPGMEDKEDPPMMEIPVLNKSEAETEEEERDMEKGLEKIESLANSKIEIEEVTVYLKDTQIYNPDDNVLFKDIIKFEPA